MKYAFKPSIWPKNPAFFVKYAILILAFTLCATLVSAGGVQDSFNRTDRTLNGDTATNGETWSTTGSAAPNITSNEGWFYDTGTDPRGNLSFDKIYTSTDDGFNLSWQMESDANNKKCYFEIKTEGGSSHVTNIGLLGTGNIRAYVNNGWQDIQAYSGGVEYDFILTVYFSNSTFDLYVDGVDKGNYQFGLTANNATYIAILSQNDAECEYDEIKIDEVTTPTPTTNMTFNTPTNYSHTKASSVNFNVTINSPDSTVNLTVYIDGVVNHTNTSVTANASYTGFTYNGDYGGHKARFYINDSNGATEDSIIFSLTKTRYTLTLNQSHNLTAGIPSNGEGRGCWWDNTGDYCGVGTKSGAHGGNEGQIFRREQWGSLNQTWDVTGSLNTNSYDWHPTLDVFAMTTGSTGNTNVRIYNATNFSFIRTLPTEEGDHWSLFTSNGNFLISEWLDYSAGNDAEIQVYNTTDSNPDNWTSVFNTSDIVATDIYHADICGDLFAFEINSGTDVTRVWNVSGNDPSVWNATEEELDPNYKNPHFSANCSFLGVVSGTSFRLYRTADWSIYKTLTLPVSNPSHDNYPLSDDNNYGFTHGYWLFHHTDGSYLLDLSNYSFVNNYTWNTPLGSYGDSFADPTGNYYVGGGGTIDKNILFTLQGAPSANPTIQVKAYDFYDNSSVSNFTVTLDNGTSFSTSTGTVTISNVSIGNYRFNVSSIAGSTGAYYSLEAQPYYTFINASNLGQTYTKNVYPKQAQINFSAYEIVTNNTLTGVTYTVNGTGGTYFVLKAANNYQVTATKAGYYNKIVLFNVSALENTTKNVEEVYNSILNVTAQNLYTSADIDTFSITVSNAANSFSTQNTTTGGEAYAPVLKNLNYTVSITATGYAGQTATVNSSSTVTNHTFNLLPANSAQVFFRYINDSLVTELINLTLINSTAAVMNSTTTGSIVYTSLIPDDFELRTESANFIDRKYFFNLTANNTLNITVYLTLNLTNITTELQVFRILDTTNEEISGATLRVEKETTTGSNLYTDYAQEITNAEGESNVYLEKGINNFYRFAVVYEGEVKRIYPSLDYYTSKTNFISGVSETVEIVVLLDDTVTTDYYNELYGITSSMGIYNNTVWFAWLDGQNSINGGKLVIKGKYLDNTTSYETLDIQTLGLTTGNLTYTFTVINNTIYQAEGYVYYSDYDLLLHTQTKSYNVNKNVDDDTGLIFAVLILVITAFLTVRFGAMLSSAVTFAMLAFTNIVGFTSFPITVVTSLIALAIILLVKWSKNEQ